MHDAVITESGRTLGTVQDVIILGGGGARVVGFEIGGGVVGDGLIPISAQTGVSGSSLIVPDVYEQRIRADLTGFASELAGIEDGPLVIRLRDLLGQDAISLSTAERTGKVKGVVIRGNRIVAVDIGDMTIEADAVRSFEGDVFTYDHASAVPVQADTPIGRRVLDTRGDELGQIDDLEIDAQGTIEFVVLGDGRRLDGRLLGAIGSYAAIVSSELPPPTGPPLH